MLRFLISCGLVCCGLIMVIYAGEMGPGVWHVNYVKKCEEEYHKFKFDISQNKINRTHDGFNAKMVMDQKFDDGFGIRVDICKYVDGGCKPYQVLSDDCFINFVNKYAKNNVAACLELAGVDPPEFPISEGDYEFNDYVFDYSELPDDGAYGEFCAKCYVLENTENEVGCIEIILEFSEEDDDDEDEA